ncbi:MAG TPA: PilZ domain-containing protein [Blastocatellia bacterium]|jgi:hypothetical protein|nr:PilZ domain-containing protein [Blastocatellia bacterium]
MSKTSYDNKTTYDEERRNSQRFRLDWYVAVKGTDPSGSSFVEAGSLENLSSKGAFVYLSKGLDLGQTLELQIKIPVRTDNWMNYTAEVVRLEHASTRVGVGVRFDTAVPVFVVR